MITNIHLLRLRNDELLAFLGDFIEHCGSFDLAALMLNLSVGELESIFALLKSAYNKEQGSKITKDIELLDGKRDAAIIGIGKVCSGYAMNDMEELASAANLLLKSIERSGGSIAEQSYVVETTSLRELAELWTTDNACINALNKLDLTDWANRMFDYNEQLNKKQIERDAEAGGNKGKSFTELRPQAYAAYNKVCKHILAYSIANEAQKESYESLAANINEMIDRYKSMLDKRGASTPSDNDTDE